MSIRIPLSKTHLTVRGGAVATHTTVDTAICELLVAANGNEWKTASAQEAMVKGEHTGQLESVTLRVSTTATGILEPWRGKPKKLHHLILLAAGVTTHDDTFGKSAGSINIDHLTGDPSNNLLENLRVVRGELNLMMKSDTRSGINKPEGVNNFRFNLPLFTTVAKSVNEISETMRACGYAHQPKIRFPSRHAAEVAKSKAANAVLDWLSENEPTFFNARKHSGDAANPCETFSLLPELRTRFAPPPPQPSIFARARRPERKRRRPEPAPAPAAAPSVVVNAATGSSVTINFSPSKRPRRAAAPTHSMRDESTQSTDSDECTSE